MEKANNGNAKTLFLILGDAWMWGSRDERESAF
jgi:hypothetical protein